MIDFTALETEKTKIRQMSLKELFSYGEKLYYIKQKNGQKTFGTNLKAIVSLSMSVNYHKSILPFLIY